MPKSFVLPLHLFLYVVGHVLSDLIPTWSWSILLLFATCIFFLIYSRNGMLSLILFVLLPFWFTSDNDIYPSHFLQHNSRYSLQAVIQETTLANKGNRFVLDVWRCTKGNTNMYTSFQLDWTPKACTDLSRGDSIQLRGRFFAYSTESPYESSYEAYRLRQGVLGCLSPYAKLVHHIPSQHKPSLDEKIKSYIWNRPKTYSFQNEIGVIEALLTGTRSSIPQEILKLYQSTGTIHVMSISGLHVGLLIALLLPFRPKASTSNRWIWAVLCGISLLLFAAYFGHKPSVIRATLMTSKLIFSKACLRSFPIWNALLLAAAVQCALDPTLVYDIGFQLSFGAVLGIVVCMPKFLTYAPKNTMLKALFSLLMVSVCAQLFTWPILLSSFGYLSWISPLTNLVIVPFLPFHISLNILYYILAVEWIRLPSLILLQWQHGILKLFSHWTWGQYSISKEESNLVLSYGMALMINIGIWGALQRSIRIFMAGLIGITLLLWL